VAGVQGLYLKHCRHGSKSWIPAGNGKCKRRIIGSRAVRGCLARLRRATLAREDEKEMSPSGDRFLDRERKEGGRRRGEQARVTFCLRLRALHLDKLQSELAIQAPRQWAIHPRHLLPCNWREAGRNRFATRMCGHPPPILDDKDRDGATKRVRRG